GGRVRQRMGGQNPRAQIVQRLRVAPRKRAAPRVARAGKVLKKRAQHAAQARRGIVERAAQGGLLVQAAQKRKPRGQKRGGALAKEGAGVEEAALRAVIPRHARRQQGGQVARVGGGHHGHGAGEQGDGPRGEALAAQRERPQPVRGAGGGERGGHRGGKRR